MVDVAAAFKGGLAASVADEVGSDLDFAWLCGALGTPEHFLLPIDCIARHLVPRVSSCDMSEENRSCTADKEHLREQSGAIHSRR